MSQPDHYATLGVAKDASLDDIKRAYRRSARHAHPDRGGSHERMQALNQAKDVLTDPERRARYDAGEDDVRETVEDSARALILQLFAEAIDLNAPDPFRGALNGLKEGIEKADQKTVATQRAIARMNGQRDRLTAKTERNVFKELLDGAIASAEASLAKLEATKAAAQRAIDILTSEYEPGPGVVEPSIKSSPTLDDFKGHPIFLGRPSPPFFSRDLYDQF